MSRENFALELTDKEGKTIYVLVHALATIEHAEKGSLITMTTGEEVEVKEPLDLIMQIGERNNILRKVR